MASHPDFFVLYVNQPETSTPFYIELLGKEPVFASKSFVSFALSSGVMLGLCSRHTVEPSAQLTGGGCELAITLPDRHAIDATHSDWLRRNWPVAQAPVLTDYGYTCVTLDPDGHRIRVFAPIQS